MMIVGSQGQNVGSRTDRSQILIGERVQLELLVKLPGNGYTVQVELPDSIEHFEVLGQSAFDTTNNQGVYSMRQRIVFTSFDSGRWYFPSFPVIIRQGNTYKRFETEPALIFVGYMPADSTNELRDIRTVIEVTLDDYTWWYVAGGILIALLLGLLYYWYQKNKKNKPLPILHSNQSPYDEAMEELAAVAQLNLQEHSVVKKYHTRLAEALKKYYSRLYQQNVMSETTGSFLVKVKEVSNDPEMISSLAQALRTGDAVKFAKYNPGLTENNTCLTQVKQVIESLKPQT